MAQKLEVLKPRNGAPFVAPPRVVSDASMSLSFKLPASYVRPAPRAPVVLRPSSARTVAEEQQQTHPSVIQSKQPRDAWSDGEEDEEEDKEEEEISWEDRDFSAQIEPTEAATPLREDGNDDADDEEEKAEESATMAMGMAMAALEIGGWEEQDAPDLPDDFPLLLVNLSRMQREHFPQERSAGANAAVALTDDEMKQVFELVKDTLHRHFTQMVEVLFEQKSCFHCTYGTSRGMLTNLHAAYPKDVFGLIDYPTEIQGIELSEFLHVLSRSSRWKSVDYLKDCLRRCSRDPKWKLDIATELEVLADKEYEIYTTEQERLSTEIDELTRLRDSFKAKLEKLAAKEREGGGNGKKASGQQCLLLRKLEDIETRLVSLLDTYLQEPELEESECDSMFGDVAGGGGGQNGLTTGMNVLDMVIAMIFSRLPRDFSQQLTNEEHFEMLFDHHIHIRRLWKKDFGRLPPRTNASVYAAALDSDDEDGEAQEMNSQEEQLRHEHQAFHRQDQYENDDEGENDEEGEEFHRYENVQMPTHRTSTGGGDLRNKASSSSDSWESVYAEEVREDHLSESGGEDADDEDGAAKSDGYGADYDSDESEDDLLAAATTTTTTTTTMSAVSASAKVSRRVRVRKPKPLFETEEKPSVVVNEEKKPKKEKKSKYLKKEKSKSKSKKKKQQEEDQIPFQPFACTGALNFLRIAKENEMF